MHKIFNVVLMLFFAWAIPSLQVLAAENKALATDNAQAGTDSGRKTLKVAATNNAVSTKPSQFAGSSKDLKKAMHSSNMAGPTFVECDNCPVMMRLPAGSFEMGFNTSGDDEKSAHKVKLEAFAISQTEVTQAEWRAVMGSDPANLYFKGCDICPVDSVSWTEAKGYVAKLAAKTGKPYRLPSEAEWEYACQAGEKHTYCGGENLNELAWYAANSGSKVHAVGQKEANAWELYDMSGNVMEWVEDCYHDNYSGAPKDGSAWVYSECTSRVFRGGAWRLKANLARATDRDSASPSENLYVFGFRVARTLP
jgi:formylglycine-generating enzyme required for sulfatase activity